MVSTHPMKILVIGAGAIGGYVGGLLALAGHDVVFAVRAKTAEALVANGLRIHGPRGDWHVKHVKTLHDPTIDIGSFDVGISCVKLYDAQSSAQQWAAQLRKCGAVISLQNGIDGQQRVAAGCGVQTVYGGFAYVAAKLQEPGRIAYLSDMSSIVFGGPGAMQDACLARFVHCISALNESTPFTATRVQDIISAQWQKFTVLATNAALTCLTRCPAGVVYHDPDLIALAEQSIVEVIRVGTACGAKFAPDHADKTLAFLQELPPGLFASMHHDLMAGKPLELDGISATIVALGRIHGIATPFHAMAYACLKPYREGARVKHGQAADCATAFASVPP